MKKHDILLKQTLNMLSVLVMADTLFKALIYWVIPCEMKLEVNSQISKHELKPLHLAQNEGFCFRKANCDTSEKNVTHVTLLFWNYFF